MQGRYQIMKKDESFSIRENLMIAYLRDKPEMYLKVLDLAIDYRTETGKLKSFGEEDTNSVMEQRERFSKAIHKVQQGYEPLTYENTTKLYHDLSGEEDVADVC
eukprot:TRINITY_DN98068_c0_g1_i1.p1 TRINITY_DN98068_c0_g1~~TRINITY_DN98068_c0_g1_i1.p1  ORF type:complete len:104 (+),score=23.55 TRINITY_DN98068_c0_g1_i1:37-348(+)